MLRLGWDKGGLLGWIPVTILGIGLWGGAVAYAGWRVGSDREVSYREFVKLALVWLVLMAALSRVSWIVAWGIGCGVTAWWLCPKGTEWIGWTLVVLPWTLGVWLAH